ncbi:hypothetical protein HRG_001378 [Hirsutella rhossiliensis]|uniref:Uncharacterized protein n=1 Tax=Hirsutella rhossiliensis TaxID=111463 RepID=A0A9P8SQ06_9HYPO|nr:uncharacterized protein HRG_01378 [Hirsutella rhossiliensis]KAH0968736.1 hypothetical protein HRG_01378 [Hirsutella rhossiliensis]
MTESVLFDIRNWIPTYLTPKYGLDTSKKEKSGIFIDDLAIMLNHLWIRDEEIFAHERLRVQLSVNLILAGATATRPGALIGQLLYENLEFQLFPPLEWYDLRRGSGKKLNEALTPEERNKIMGHRRGDSSTYLQYYMSNFIDVDCYRSREHAEGTEMQKRYDRYNKKINNLRRVLKASQLQKAIQDFHTNVHVDEVDRQLRGVKPADVISPPNIEHGIFTLFACGFDIGTHPALQAT